MAQGGPYRHTTEGDGRTVLGRIDTDTLRVFQGIAGLDQIAADWQTITASSPHQEFFHSIDWCRCHLESLAKNSENAVFFLISEKGKPLAIFPFFRSTQNFGIMRNRVLGLPDHPHVPFGDFVIAPEADISRCLAMLFDELCQQAKPEWDCIFLPRVFELFSTAATRNADGSPGVILISHPAEPCDYLPVKPYGALFEELSAGARSNLRRSRKRAQQLENLEYSSISTFPGLEKAFDELLYLEGSGWKGEQGSGTAIRLDPQLVSFYRSLLERFAPRGECVIHRLRDGDRPICAALGLVSNATYYGLKMGYDEEFKMLGPGNLLQEYILQHCAESGTVGCLNLVSHTSWQRSWKPLQHETFALALFNRTLRGRVLSILHRLRNRSRVLKHQCRERFFVRVGGKLRLRGLRLNTAREKK